jgi:hypothetical protein
MPRQYIKDSNKPDGDHSITFLSDKIYNQAEPSNNFNMSKIPQLNNKVSTQDIDVELYKTRASELAAEKPSEPELPEGEFTAHIMSGKTHVITFKIDNTGTTFNLNADSRTFADWGSFSGAPNNVTDLEAVA